jgi:hypothetical protein
MEGWMSCHPTRLLPYLKVYFALLTGLSDQLVACLVIDSRSSTSVK